MHLHVCIAALPSAALFCMPRIFRLGVLLVPDAAVNFSTMVLTNGTWPLQASHELRLPQELAGCMERFTAFYNVRPCVSPALAACCPTPPP